MLDNVCTDEIIRILTQCDTDYYAYPDDLVELSYQLLLLQNGDRNQTAIVVQVLPSVLSTSKFTILPWHP